MQRIVLMLTGMVLLLACQRDALGQFSVDIDIEAAPFRYSETQADNRVSSLVDQIKSKQIKLEYTREQGYLKSLLAALEIPESSQALVFSKTSLQVRYISRRNPRAIYFNDDTYVGWVNGSSLAEISTTDPKLGAAFYTVDMMPWRADIEQATYECLACHATSMTQGVPGHTVRSVFPRYDGGIDSQKASYITDDTSPFSQRWGGWYVTGMHGDMGHMGNAYLRGGTLDTRRNANLASVRDELDSSNYLSPYSDIVALMVLEHQTQTHNAMVKADFSVRKLLHEASTAGQSDESEQEWQIQLQGIAKAVVDRMLFRDEAPLTSQITGSVTFAADFASRGPKDPRGRSLRDFDLQTRMFKYPLSYLVYSNTFDSLQACLRNEVYRQMHAILLGESRTNDFPHMTPEVRAETLAILRATKNGYPF